MTEFALKTHKEWRKAAKKVRRKRIRQQSAELRKKLEKQRESSPTFLLELTRKHMFQEYEMEKEEKRRRERQLKWLEDEARAQKQWKEEQRLKALVKEEKLKEQERIRKEWESEQQKIKEQKKTLEALKKEEEKRRLDILEKINDFICSGGEVPLELQSVTETNPDKEICSFYQKVGACRFGSQCSRNHQYYKISNVLMFINFYSHFTLDQTKSSEYDTDIGLEYEESDMYLHFKEFYNDIVPEFKRFGELTMVKVCCNIEFHLRGNVYVEYKNEREALAAYKAFQGRWYGGKQIKIEFVKIRDWGSAVCGDFARHRCPKGNSCNFLHAYKNPKNEFSIDWTKNRNTISAQENFVAGVEKCKSRSWRWSETPEPSLKRIKQSLITERLANGRQKSKSLKKMKKHGSSEKKKMNRHKRSKQPKM